MLEIKHVKAFASFMPANGHADQDSRSRNMRLRDQNGAAKCTKTVRPQPISRMYHKKAPEQCQWQSPGAFDKCTSVRQRQPDVWFGLQTLGQNSQNPFTCCSGVLNVVRIVHPHDSAIPVGLQVQTV